MLPVGKIKGDFSHKEKRLGDKYPLLLRDWKKQGAEIVYENHYRNQSNPSVHSEGFFVIYLHFSGVEIYWFCYTITN
jgi:hypothetical protein